MNTLNTLPNTPCHLNGLTLPLNEAKVSVLDRGFIFGDGIYEVAPVYQGKLFRFEQHMARMARSLAELRIPTHTPNQAGAHSSKTCCNNMPKASGNLSTI